MILDFSSSDTLLQFEEKLPEFIVLFLKNWFSDSKFMKLQTSGSTGTPKILDVEKDKMLNSAKMTCDFLGLKEGNTALLCLPTEYISGKMILVRAIERRMKLLIQTPSLFPLENITKEIDFCAMTPLQVQNSLDKIHCIKKLIIGGASISESLKQQLIQKNPRTKIYETYGMSETLSHIALKSISPKREEYFRVLDGIKISQDQRGCLVINAPLLNDKILITNDLIKLKNKREFNFLGRIDNIINSGGIKISPENLEDWIKKFIPNELVFIGIPDINLGEKLVLVLEGKEDLNLKSHILQLPFEKKYLKPKEIIFIEKIPRTPNNKIDRLGLKNLLYQ